MDDQVRAALETFTRARKWENLPAARRNSSLLIGLTILFGAGVGMIFSFCTDTPLDVAIAVAVVVSSYICTPWLILRDRNLRPMGDEFYCYNAWHARGALEAFHETGDRSLRSAACERLKQRPFLWPTSITNRPWFVRVLTFTGLSTAHLVIRWISRRSLHFLDWIEISEDERDTAAELVTFGDRAAHQLDQGRMVEEIRNAVDALVSWTFHAVLAHDYASLPPSIAEKRDTLLQTTSNCMAEFVAAARRLPPVPPQPEPDYGAKWRRFAESLQHPLLAGAIWAAFMAALTFGIGYLLRISVQTLFLTWLVVGFSPITISLGVAFIRPSKAKQPDAK